MLHKFFAPGPWFAAKRFGYGAGWPIAPQGWALVISYGAAIAGIVALAQQQEGSTEIVAGGLLLICTALFVLIARKRTDGGWRWRNVD